MQRILNITYPIVLIILLSYQMFATGWYVDKNATGSNNGTSWANAWESFSAINWSSINPNDTLFISGGAGGDSVTYFEKLTVGASGTSGNEIVVTPGKDAGHNGIVVFDGENQGRNCIEFASANYVILDGQNRLRVYRGGYGSSGMIQIDNVNNITIQYCYFNEVYGNGAIRIDGADYYRTPPHNIVIRYNDMYMGTNSSPSTTTSADNIVVNDCNGLWVDHNNIIGDNTLASCDGGRHCDNIQVYRHSGNIIVSNNYMYDFDVNSCHQMLMWENIDGTNVFYNNIFYMPNKTDGNTILDKSNVYPSTKVYYYIHNTMITGTNYNQLNLHTASFYGYNNLFQATAQMTHSHGIDPGSGFDWTKIQGTLFGNNYSTGWEGLSLSSIQSLGGDTSGVYYVDPMLTYGQVLPDVYPNDDFHLLAGSPAINAGVYELGGGLTVRDIVEGFGLVWEDMDGSPRGSSPDIGAYEYTTGGWTPPDTTATVALSTVTNAELNSYHIGSGVLSGADSTFHIWTTTADSFRVNSGTLNTTMVTAVSGNTLYIPVIASSQYSTSVTNYVVVSGTVRSFTVTTKAQLPIPPSSAGKTIKGFNGKLLRDSTGKIIKMR